MLFGFCRNPMHRGARGDEHKAQVDTETRQHIVILPRYIHVHLGGQCRADQPQGARLFQLLVHPGAPGFDLQPCGNRLAIQLRIGQTVPFFEKYTAIIPATQHLPCLLCGKAEDRRDQAHQTVGDVIQRILRGAAGGGIFPGGVQTVFQNVEIETTQILGTESLQFLCDQMEFVARVICDDFTLQLSHPCQRIAVDFQPLLHRQGMLLQIEIGNIGQQKTQRVADAPVAFHHALENFVGDRQLAGIVGRGRPQAQDVGAERIEYFLRGDHIPFGFRHLVAAAIDHKTVRQQGLERRAAIDRTAGQQR